MGSIYLFVFYYQYRINAELPIGKKKEAPIKFNEKAIVDPNPKQKKEPTPPPMEPTGKAPDSQYFQPKRNVTAGKNAGNETQNKPSGPPPNPHQKPNGPPPRPPR